jgi:cystinosin
MYVGALYFSATIQDLYHKRYGADAQISVQSNDVAFAVHALIMSLCTLGQIAYYDGLRSQRPSRLILYTIAGMLTTIALTPVLVVLRGRGWWRWQFTWLDYLYILSYMKIGVTLIKYIPQALLNYKRKSTLGWSKS